MISSSTKLLLFSSSAALASAAWVPFLDTIYPTGQFVHIPMLQEMRQSILYDSATFVAVFDSPEMASDALDKIEGRIFTSSGGISISNSTLSISALATAGLLGGFWSNLLGPEILPPRGCVKLSN